MHTTRPNKTRVAQATIIAILLCVSATAAHAAQQKHALYRHRTKSSATAPSITAEPASRTVIAGLTASFSVTATGTAPLIYQWRMNGTAITGATSSTYTTAATTTSENAAQFTVVVSNSAGSATSSAAVLTVGRRDRAPEFQSHEPRFRQRQRIDEQHQDRNADKRRKFQRDNRKRRRRRCGLRRQRRVFWADPIERPKRHVDRDFDPAASGGATGSITVTSNATNSLAVIALSGTGVAQAYSVDLNWSTSTSSVVGYNVYSGTASGGPYTKLTSSPVPSTTYTDSSVQQGKTYYFVVTSVNSDNIESAYSTQVSAVIP